MSCEEFIPAKMLSIDFDSISATTAKGWVMHNFGVGENIIREDQFTTGSSGISWQLSGQIYDMDISKAGRAEKISKSERPPNPDIGTALRCLGDPTYYGVPGTLERNRGSCYVILVKNWADLPGLRRRSKNTGNLR